MSPTYRQIAEDLRQQIESGALASGSQLPTEFELRERYTASRNTVRDAIRWLATLGVVVTRPGQGTFVTEAITPFVTTLSGDPSTGWDGDEGASYLCEVTERNRKPVSSSVQVEIQQPPDDVAASLWINQEAEVISRHKRRFIDGESWSMQTSYQAEMLTSYQAQMLRVRQFGYRDRVTARSPKPAEVDFFKPLLDDCAAVCEIPRTAFDGNEQPVRLTITVFPTDPNQFTTEISDGAFSGHRCAYAAPLVDQLL